MFFKRLLAAGMLLGMSGHLFAGDQWLLVGTYTNSGSYGIYVYRFHPETATSVLVDSIAVENPSYLSISADHQYVYSITENGVTKPGSVSAFQFDNRTGHLSFLNEAPSGGDHPCYVTINKTGDWLAVANYSGGSLSVLPVDKNGKLQPPAQTIQQYGSGPVTNRQDKPHVHMTMFSPDEKYLFANDLGTDKILAYPFKSSLKKPLDTEHTMSIETPAGAGPRHLTFHPVLPVFYILEELTGTVGVYAFREKKWQRIQTIVSDTVSSLPDKGSADIHVSPDGKYLYASNRGKANSLSIYSIDPRTGQLTMIGSQPVLGIKPRNFTLDVTGNYILVANQDSKNIVCFRRDASSGLLEWTGNIISVPSPVCLKMIPVK